MSEQKRNGKVFTKELAEMLIMSTNGVSYNQASALQVMRGYCRPKLSTGQCHYISEKEAVNLMFRLHGSMLDNKNITRENFFDELEMYVARHGIVVA